MSFSFSTRSLSNLEGVHPDLVRVMHRALAITKVDFTVVEGLRTLERQKWLFANGKSKTMKSRHLNGHAVDIYPYVNGKVVTTDWKWFNELAVYVKKAAEDEGVDLEWGGDWRTFKDGPHWQLSWESYPSAS